MGDVSEAVCAITSKSSNNVIITIDARETNLYNDIIDRDLDNYK